MNIDIVCNDADNCTEDSCDTVLGCVNNQLDCSDNDPCTADFCNPLVGCLNQPDPSIPGCEGKICENDDSCDDSNLCTTDTCDLSGEYGVCEFEIKECFDGVPCTNDFCNPLDGTCNFTPKACDDSNLCTNDSLIQRLVSAHTRRKIAMMVTPCTDDICNSETVHALIY